MRGRLWLYISSIVLPLLGAGCERDTLLAPGLEAAFRQSDAPSALNLVVVAYNRIDVSWRDNSPNETGFEVHRGATANGPFSLLTTTAAGVTSYPDGGLTGATPYCYKVRAFRITGKNTTYSEFSNTACATTPPPPAPAVPSGANAIPQYSTAVRVTWVDNSNDENGFRVEFSATEAGPWTSAGPDLPANSTAFDHSGRASDQQVCYRVIAFNSLASSAPSNVDCTAPPFGPDQLTAVGVSGPAIDLTWKDNSAVEDGYEVRRAPPDGQFITVAVLSPNAGGYHDAGIVADTRYTYSIAARKDGGYSNFSSVSALAASAPPSAPSPTQAWPMNSSGILISWTEASQNVDAFRVEYSADGGASWSTAGTTPSYQQQFGHSGVATEQRACYRVFASNSAGESEPSDVVCTIPPAGPTNLIATSAEGSAIDLTWTDNSAFEDGYEVWRLLTNCDYYYGCYSYWDVIATVAANATSYRDVGLNPGEFYQYFVVAKKDGGSSDESNEADAYPGPTAP